MRKSLKTPISSIEKVDTQKTGNKAIKKIVADREGFEPSVTLRLRILSRDVVSANSPICPSEVEGKFYLIFLKKYLNFLQNFLC